LLGKFLDGITDPEESIIQCFKCRAQYLLDTNYGGCSYIRIVAEMPQRSEKINRQVILNKEKQRRFFTDHAKKIKGTSSLAAKDLANTIFLLFDGATMQCQVYRELLPLKDALKAVKALL